MGHTDVVPVTREWLVSATRSAASSSTARCGAAARSTCSTSPRRWRSPPSTWRGTGFRPKGTLLYFAVADEEAGGHWGAEWALDHERDAVAADYVVTESGGLVMDTHAGQRVTITVAEKGVDVAAAARPRHAGPRVDAVRCRQRPREGGRGRAPPRHLRAPRPDHRPLGELRRRVRSHRCRAQGTSRSRHGDARPAATSPTRVSRSSPTRARTRRSRRTSPTVA